MSFLSSGNPNLISLKEKNINEENGTYKLYKISDVFARSPELNFVPRVNDSIERVSFLHALLTCQRRIPTIVIIGLQTCRNI